MNYEGDALYYSLKCYNIVTGEELLVSDFSWISSASCIVMAGATPIFCDIDLNSYHISFKEIQKKTTNKTKAIVYTHLFGNMTETKEIEKYCKKNNIIFIKDATQSLAAFIEMRFDKDKINKLQSRRIQVANKYHEKLKELPVIIQVANNDLIHNYHKYVVRFKNKEIRDKVKNKLNAKIYSDLTSCSNAQKASDTVLFLPCHPYVTENKINQICTKL